LESCDSGDVAVALAPAVSAAVWFEEPVAMPEAAEPVAPGARVEVCGMTAQPHLNGQFATVVEWDEGEGRWKVRMDDGTGKILKSVNLILCRDVVTQSGQPLLETPPVASLPMEVAPPPTSDSIAAGSRVRICDVSAQPQLNGQSGIVVEWEAGECRWKVRMEDGSEKMLRAVNLESCDSGDVPVALAPAVSATVSPEQPVATPEATEPIAPGARVEVCSIKAQPYLTDSMSLSWIGSRVNDVGRCAWTAAWARYRR